MFNTVRTKLTLWYTGVLALVLVLFSSGVYLLTAHRLAARLNAGLRTAVEGTARLYVHERDEGEEERHAAESSLRKHYAPHQAVAIYDGRGGLVAEKMLFGKIHAPLPAARDTDEMRFLTLPGVGPQDGEADDEDDDGLRLALQRVKVPSTGAVYFIVGGEPLAELDEDLELLRHILYAAVPAALLLVGLSGWWLARRSLAPVVAMADSARRIGAENLAGRLPVANPRDELGQLAATFNQLLARLNAAFDQQRQFMADASHELRTPLSVLHTTAEVTLELPHRSEPEYREALALMDEQTRRLTRIVEEMFMLARADAGRRPLEPRDFYLDELLAEVVRAARVLGTRRGVAVALQPVGETPFRGDENLLRQMLLNLLDNAIKHTLPGGTVTISLKQAAATCEIAVTDTGTGIPPAAQPHIFERFYCADRARARVENGAGSGVGLGLSIARWIAEAHDGRLELRRSDAHGSTFAASLPVPDKATSTTVRYRER